MEGWKLLVVRQLDAENRETGGYVVAADAVGRGRRRGRPLRHRQLRPPDRDDPRPALRRRDHGDRRHLGGRRDGGLPQVAGGGHERARRARDRGDHRAGAPARGGGRRRAAGRRPARGGGAVGRRRGGAGRRHPRHDRRRRWPPPRGPSRAFGGSGPRGPQGHHRRGPPRRCSTTPSSSPGWPTRRPTSGASTTRSSRTASSPSKAPGPEDLEVQAVTGDAGMMVTEFAPFGVVARDHPGHQPDLHDHQQHDQHRLGRQRRRLQRPPQRAALLGGDDPPHQPGDRRRRRARRTSSPRVAEPDHRDAPGRS